MLTVWEEEYKGKGSVKETTQRNQTAESNLCQDWGKTSLPQKENVTKVVFRGNSDHTAIVRQ